MTLKQPVQANPGPSTPHQKPSTPMVDLSTHPKAFYPCPILPPSSSNCIEILSQEYMTPQKKPRSITFVVFLLVILLLNSPFPSQAFSPPMEKITSQEDLVSVPKMDNLDSQ